MGKYIKDVYHIENGVVYKVDTRGIIDAKDKTSTLENRLQGIETILLAAGKHTVITQDEYDALSPEQKLDNIVYFIEPPEEGKSSIIYYKDNKYGGGNGDAIAKTVTQAEFDALPQEEKDNGTIYFIKDNAGTVVMTWGDIIGDINNQNDLKLLFATKQDKLIAGENITIDENNVISSTGGGGDATMFEVIDGKLCLVYEMEEE